ncbi:MAG: hypothetical protein KAY99_02945 [Faecalibacterium sp.]|nr:hypothetical protein [Faecalibacterium sp.]
MDKKGEKYYTVCNKMRIGARRRGALRWLHSRAAVASNRWTDWLHKALQHRPGSVKNTLEC